MSSHSSLETSSLKEAFEGQRQRRKTAAVSNSSSKRPSPTYLQNVDTLPRDVAVDLVLVVEVSPIHFRRLIHGMLDLYRDATTSL